MHDSETKITREFRAFLYSRLLKVLFASTMLGNKHRVVSSVVERLVYTEDVGGSKPSPPTTSSTD